MRPTREGRHTPLRVGLVFSGIGVDPSLPTDDPEDPIDFAASSNSGQAFIPFLSESTEDRFFGSTIVSGGAGFNDWFDDDATTWEACIGTFNVVWDAGTTADISTIVIAWSYGDLVPAGGAAADFTIEGSDSALGPWTEVLTDADPPGTAGVSYPEDFENTYVLGATHSYRYWRFHGNGVGNNDIIALEGYGADQTYWVPAPFAIDGSDATYEYVRDFSGADVEILRHTLDDDRLIGASRLLASVPSNTPTITLTLQGATQSDYSDATTVASRGWTPTGTFTADELTMIWAPTAVYQFWQYAITPFQDIRIFESSLYEASDTSSAVASNSLAIGGVVVGNAAASNTHLVATSSNTGIWLPHESNYLYTTEGGLDKVFAHGNLGTAKAIDPSAGNVHSGTLNANCTITLQAPAQRDGGNAHSLIEVQLTENGTGGYTPTFAASGGTISWAGGSAPTHTTTASTTTVYLFETIDGGVTWLGYQAGGGGSTTFADYVRSETTFGLTASAGSSNTASRGDHTHGTPANPVSASALTALGVRGELVIKDGASSPPVFDDIVTNDANTDFVYADLVDV